MEYSLPAGGVCIHMHDPNNIGHPFVLMHVFYHFSR